MGFAFYPPWAQISEEILSASFCRLTWMAIGQDIMKASRVQCQLSQTTPDGRLLLLLAVCFKTFLAMAGYVLRNIFIRLPTDPSYCALLSVGDAYASPCVHHDSQMCAFFLV